MARIKFNSDIETFNGSIQGQTFYAGYKISTIRNIASMRLSTTPPQKIMSLYLVAADRLWRDMDPVNQYLWNSFAIEFPQQQVKHVDRFLTGYQLFVKRNQHFQIFHNETPQFMESPSFVELFADFPSVTITISGTSLLLNLTFPRGTSDLDCLCSLSLPFSPGKSSNNSGLRLNFRSLNVSSSIDVSQAYLSIFGKLPLKNQTIAFDILQMGKDNGQYFFKDPDILIVTEPIPPIFIPHWGYLYNSFDLASFAPSGWRIPTIAESYALFSAEINCLSLIYPSDDFWLNSSTATNTKLFSAVGSGMRDPSSGLFIFFKSRYVWANVGFSTGSNWAFQMPSGLVTGSDSLTLGVSVRFIKNSAGSVPSVTGHNGIIYPTIDINGLCWMKEDSRETIFSDGSPIPLVSSNLEWISLSSQAYCVNPDTLM